eukprot:1158089-Pelagomonas_calceolata.AAC.3
MHPLHGPHTALDLLPPASSPNRHSQKPKGFTVVLLSLSIHPALLIHKLLLLRADPSEKIATQLSLLVTNIARFDFPGRSPELLEALAGFANWDSPHPPQSVRAFCMAIPMRAIVYVLILMHELIATPSTVCLMTGAKLKSALERCMNLHTYVSMESVVEAVL